MTRWLDYISTFGHLHQRKFAQWHTKLAKVGLKFCQILNEPSKNCPRLWRYCQSGEISPNLVTLSKLVSHWGKPESDVTQRQVRRLLAEGRITSYDKGELVVKLQDMDFGEEEALLAAENCEDVYSATKFLRQECELCANTMNVTEVQLQNIFKIKTFLKPHSHGFYWGHQC